MRRRTTRTASLTLTLTAGTAGLLLAACSTGSAPAQHRSVATSAPASTPTATTAPATSPAPGTSAPAATPTTSAVTSRSATVPPAPGTNPPAAPHVADPCPAAALTVRLLPGGAAQGIEYAAVSITNTGAAACNLRGYPRLVLRDGNGAALATAAPLPGSVAHLVRLAPGQEAQAQVQDHSTCQAPLSSSVAVAAPAPSSGAATINARPLNQLRACTVYVAPVGMAS